MKTWIKWTGGALAAGFAALQLTNPPLTNPPVKLGGDLLATNPPPANVAALLKAACYNCHSHETEWPWYSHLAPFSWGLARDVEEGRGMLNFSEWPHDNPSRARKRWRHVASQVEDREMPLPKYVLMHPSARLSDEQRAQIVQWARKAAGD